MTGVAGALHDDAIDVVRLMLRLIRRDVHAYLWTQSIRGRPATISQDDWDLVREDLAAIAAATALTGPIQDDYDVDTEWLDEVLAWRRRADAG